MESRPPLPPDVRAALVDVLAAALVADFRRRPPGVDCSGSPADNRPGTKESPAGAGTPPGRGRPPRPLRRRDST